MGSEMCIRDRGEYVGVEDSRINEIVGDANYDLTAYNHEAVSYTHLTLPTTPYV
ncbi:hypothetical protein CDFC105_30354 [Clostridioides difficile]|nr:hypothetical protein CDFC105_30354 [Clostridioides difficile]